MNKKTNSFEKYLERKRKDNPILVVSFVLLMMMVFGTAWIVL